MELSIFIRKQKIFNIIRLLNFMIIYSLASIINNDNKSFVHLKEIKEENIYNLNLRNLNSPIINNKKNLVIGLAFNYSWETMRNYFISLIKAGFKNCDFVIFINGMSEETVNKIKSCGVMTIDIPDRILNAEIPINSYRWKIYSDFLKKNIDKYDKVFTSDVRDSIFQKDIFQFYEQKSFLGVFLEDGDLTEDTNKKWMLMLCSEEIYKTMADKRIICAGSLIGSVDKFIEFCNIFWEIALEKKDNGIDQAILNYIVYYKKAFEDCIIIKDNHGPLMTIGITKQDVKLDSDTNLINFDGQIAAVAHQYDKIQERLEKINKKFDDTNLNITSILIENEKQNEKEINLGKSRNKSIFKKIFIIIIIIIIIIAIRFLFLFIITKRYFGKNKYKFTRVKIRINDRSLLKKYRI